jgi:hypothetical protein
MALADLTHEEALALGYRFVPDQEAGFWAQYEKDGLVWGGPVSPGHPESSALTKLNAWRRQMWEHVQLPPGKKPEETFARRQATKLANEDHRRITGRDWM